MGLETATFISDLVTTNPVGTADAPPTLGTHSRLLKSVLKATFTKVTGAVTATHTELNYLAGLTSSAQAQINGKMTFSVTSGSGALTMAKANLSVAVETSTSNVTLPPSPNIGDVALVCGTDFFNIYPSGSDTITHLGHDILPYTPYTNYFVYYFAADTTSNWQGKTLV